MSESSTQTISDFEKKLDAIRDLDRLYDLGARAEVSRSSTSIERLCRRDLPRWVVPTIEGDLAGALLHARRALEIDQAVYGKDHPTVARDANNIGMILQAQGDLDGAREQIGRALSIFERVYGPDHHQTVIVRGNLALI